MGPIRNGGGYEGDSVIPPSIYLLICPMMPHLPRVPQPGKTAPPSGGTSVQKPDTRGWVWGNRFKQEQYVMGMRGPWDKDERFAMCSLTNTPSPMVSLVRKKN